MPSAADHAERVHVRRLGLVARVALVRDLVDRHLAQERAHRADRLHRHEGVAAERREGAVDGDAAQPNGGDCQAYE